MNLKSQILEIYSPRYEYIHHVDLQLADVLTSAQDLEMPHVPDLKLEQIKKDHILCISAARFPDECVRQLSECYDDIFDPDSLLLVKACLRLLGHESFQGLEQQIGRRYGTYKPTLDASAEYWFGYLRSLHLAVKSPRWIEYS